MLWVFAIVMVMKICIDHEFWCRKTCLLIVSGNSCPCSSDCGLTKDLLQIIVFAEYSETDALGWAEPRLTGYCQLQGRLYVVHTCMHACPVDHPSLQWWKLLDIIYTWWHLSAITSGDTHQVIPSWEIFMGGGDDDHTCLFLSFGTTIKLIGFNEFAFLFVCILTRLLVLFWNSINLESNWHLSIFRFQISLRYSHNTIMRDSILMFLKIYLIKKRVRLAGIHNALLFKHTSF